MGQKCEGNCGLWVLNEIIKNIYPEKVEEYIPTFYKIRYILEVLYVAVM